MQGKLDDMNVADLIQHLCLDRKQACLILENKGEQAKIYFTDGQMIHAERGDIVGKEVIFQVLDWQDGSFKLENGAAAPRQTIHGNWTEILLEGARLMDESSIKTDFQTPKQEVIKPMAKKKKSEMLAEALAGLLQESSDINGVAIVGIDGLVYSANVPQKGMDEAMVGATSAAVLGLGKRSAQQLARGAFKQTIIQGEDGNIIVRPLNDETLLVALTPADVNLGMAFAEVRSISKDLQDIL